MAGIFREFRSVVLQYVLLREFHTKAVVKVAEGEQRRRQESGGLINLGRNLIIDRVRMLLPMQSVQQLPGEEGNRSR